MSTAIQNFGTIAVVVPVYNVEPYIRQCLDSLLAQTYPYWEAYVVNDGSPDNCSRIIDGYAAKDSRFRVFHKPNRGGSSARNYALDMLYQSGEPYLAIGFLDSDDCLIPEAYAEIASVLSSEKPDILFHGSEYIYENNVKTLPFSKKTGIVDRLSFFKAVFNCDDWKDSNGVYGSVWNKYFKPEILSEIRFIEDYLYVEDEPFCFDSGFKAKHFYFIGKSYYLYRQRQNSLMREDVITERILRSRLKMLSAALMSHLPEKTLLVDIIQSRIMDSFLNMKKRSFQPFLKNISLYSEAAAVILEFAVSANEAGKLKDSDCEFFRKLSCFSEKTSSDVAMVVDLMDAEIRALNDRIKTLYHDKRKLSDNIKQMKEKLKQQKGEVGRKQSLLQAVRDSKNPISVLVDENRE